MRRTAFLTAAISIVLACALAVFTAGKLVDHVERHSERNLATLLIESGEDWATIRADGFRVIVGGLAENEATRFRTLQLISGNINQSRIEDRTQVSQPDGLQPPRFSLEILRNEERVSLIGLVPMSTDRDYILERVSKLQSNTQITDMLEQVDYQEPENWKASIDFALDRLNQIPRSKVSITPDRLKVTAVSDTPEQQQTLKKSLAKDKPDNVTLFLDISAPRPVIAPFQFRLKVSDGKGQLEACSADTNFAKSKITRSLDAVGIDTSADCQVGLGVPTTDWALAINQVVDAMASLKDGTVTVTDSDISLIAADTVEQALFDTTVAKLENALPSLFSLQSILTPKPLIDGQTGEVIVPDFTVTKSPEGLIQMRGQVPDALRKDTLSAFAKSLFGKDNVFNQTRIVEGLPEGWTVRSMAGLEALSKLHHGSLVIQPDIMNIRGNSADKDILSTVSRIITTRVGSGAQFVSNVNFDENLIEKVVVEEVGISDEVCQAQVAAILTARKINFAPSSSEIEAASLGVIDKIAEVLNECPEARFEINGYTDNQGGEESNLTLSQQRADSVLVALIDRRVLTSKMKSQGFGEADPIADNETAEGRAQNRRIEFRLIQKETTDGQE